MRHLKHGRKFGRERGDRRLFLRNLMHQLVMSDRIVTTEARARELRRLVERLITYGKKQNLAGLRLLLRRMPHASAERIYRELAPRYAERRGGYTRIVKHAERRVQDGAKKATIEFV